MGRVTGIKVNTDRMEEVSQTKPDAGVIRAVWGQENITVVDKNSEHSIL